MNAQQILDAIAASPELQALQAAGDHAGIAALLSVGRTRVASRLISERGIMSHYPGGPLAADALLSKLETFAESGQPGSGPVRRALKFLATEAGVDIGDDAMQAQLDAIAQAGVITTAEADSLKSLALVPDPVSHVAVTAAIRGAE